MELILALIGLTSLVAIIFAVFNKVRFFIFSKKNEAYKAKNLSAVKKNNILLLAALAAFFATVFLTPKNEKSLPDKSSNLVQTSLSNESESALISTPQSVLRIKSSKLIEVRESMTEAQRDAFFDEVRGKYASFAGYISDVEKSGEGYKVRVDIDNPSQTFTLPEITFYTEDAAALKFKKNRKIAFEGTLEEITTSVGTSLMIRLKDAKVTKLEE